MAIRTYLTLEEADALDAAVHRHNTRLRYIVREAIHNWVFDPMTGRDRSFPIEKEPDEPHREISALIPLVLWRVEVEEYRCGIPHTRGIS